MSRLSISSERALQVFPEYRARDQFMVAVTVRIFWARVAGVSYIARDDRNNNERTFNEGFVKIPRISLVRAKRNDQIFDRNEAINCNKHSVARQIKRLLSFLASLSRIEFRSAEKRSANIASDAEFQECVATKVANDCCPISRIMLKITVGNRGGNKTPSWSFERAIVTKTRASNMQKKNEIPSTSSARIRIPGYICRFSRNGFVRLYRLASRDIETTAPTNTIFPSRKGDNETDDLNF